MSPKVPPRPSRRKGSRYGASFAPAAPSSTAERQGQPIQAQSEVFADCSLDHPVGAHEERLRNCQSQSFGRPKIDYELELGRLLDRQVTRSSPLQYLVDVNGGPA